MNSDAIPPECHNTNSPFFLLQLFLKKKKKCQFLLLTVVNNVGEECFSSFKICLQGLHWGKQPRPLSHFLWQLLAHPHKHAVRFLCHCSCPGYNKHWHEAPGPKDAWRVENLEHVTCVTYRKCCAWDSSALVDHIHYRAITASVQMSVFCLQENTYLTVYNKNMHVWWLVLLKVQVREMVDAICRGK